MIEGLKIRISGKELQDHVAARAAHHKTRADHYAQKAAEEAVDMGDDIQAKVSGGNVLEQYRNKLRQHMGAHEHFHFMATHIVVAEEYQLSQEDLVFLEIITRRW